MLKKLPLALALLALTACNHKPKAPTFKVAHTYNLRGQIAQLPEKGKPYSSFMLSHEAIPDFYDADGKKVGMQGMTMEFPCSDPNMFSGFKVGDKVQAQVVVSKDLLQWDILKLEKLAPDVVLDIAP